MSQPEMLRLSCASLVALVAVGCATTSVDAPSEPGAGDGQQTAATPDLATSDLIFLVSAAEVAASRGDLAEATRLFTRAASQSSDFRVAARGFELARHIGDNAAARQNLERLKEIQGDKFDQHGPAAVFYAEIGDFKAALLHLEILRRERMDSEDDIWASLGPVIEAAARRGPEAGIEFFEKLIKEWGYAKSQSGLQSQSNIAASLGDLDRAMDIATRAVKRSDDRGSAYGWRARLHASNGDLEAAARDYESAVELKPEDRTIRVGYARLLFNQERYLEAIDQLEAVEDDPLIVFSKAYYALEAGERDRAESYYQDLTELDADNADEWAFLTGQLADELDRPDEALDWYDQVAGGERLTPARLRMAIILSDRGDLDASRALLRTLQNGNAETASQAFQVEGTLLSDAGRDDEALAVYSRAIDQMPADDDLRYARALHAERIDRVEVAEADLRDILTRNPEDPNALNALGYTLADRTDRYDEALELIERAYELAPDEAAIVDSMGWVQYRLGNYDKALKYLRKALDLQFDAEIAAHLGEVLWVLGREDEAQRVWADGLERSPDSSAIRDTQRRLVE